MFNEAKDYVVQHQEFDTLRHRYYAPHPYCPQCQLKAKSTYKLIILIADIMREEAKRNMRARLLQRNNTWET